MCFLSEYKHTPIKFSEQNFTTPLKRGKYKTALYTKPSFTALATASLMVVTASFYEPLIEELGKQKALRVIEGLLFCSIHSF